MTKRDVKRFMRRRRMSQADLATRMGVSETMMSRWFAGEAVSRPLKEKIEAHIREQSRPPAELEARDEAAQPEAIGASL
jgi:transcriptional regulator with XRE-family HTH domain